MEEVLSIKSKTYSTSVSTLLSLCFLCILSCAPAYNIGSVVKHSTKKPPQDLSFQTKQNFRPEPAPWEAWKVETYGNAALQSGMRKLSEGRIAESVADFETGLKSAKSPEEAEMAFLLMSSSLLKRGESERVLQKISKYASLQKKNAADLDARFSLITAFCYLQQNNSEQTLAWLSQAIQASSGTGKVYLASKKTARALLKAKSTYQLVELSEKWRSDPKVYELILQERNRRFQGGKPETPKYAKFFTETYYQPPQHLTQTALSYDTSMDANLVSPIDQSSETDAAKVSLGNNIPIKVGVVLPFSGDYSSHAARVYDGIDLAFKTSGLVYEIYKIDSTTSISSLGQRIESIGLHILFGPLLVRNVEYTAPFCERLKTTCITFAKRQDLPNLSARLFRLGVTAENQLLELRRFAGEFLNIKRSAVILPNNSVGDEYGSAVARINAESNGPASLFPFRFSSEDNTSLDRSIAYLQRAGVEALIFVDTPKDSKEILEQVQKSSGLSNLPILGTSLFGNPAGIERYKKLIEGAYVARLFDPSSRDTNVRSFISAYRKEYTKTPDLLAAQSYDAARVYLSSLTHGADNNESGLFRVENHPGVTGTISVLSNGEMLRRMKIVQIK